MGRLSKMLASRRLARSGRKQKELESSLNSESQTAGEKLKNKEISHSHMRSTGG